MNSSSYLQERWYSWCFHCLIVKSSNLKAAFWMSFLLNTYVLLTAGGTFCPCCLGKCGDEVLETASIAADEALDSITMPVVVYWFSLLHISGFLKKNIFHPKRMNILNYRKDETLTPKQHFNLCRLNFQPVSCLFLHILPVCCWRPRDLLRWMVLWALRLSLQWCQDPLSICRMMSFNLPTLKTDGKRVLPSLVMELSPGTQRVRDSACQENSKVGIVLVLVTGVNASIGLFWFCCCCCELQTLVDSLSCFRLMGQECHGISWSLKRRLLGWGVLRVTWSPPKSAWKSELLTALGVWWRPKLVSSKDLSQSKAGCKSGDDFYLLPAYLIVCYFLKWKYDLLYLMKYGYSINIWYIIQYKVAIVICISTGEVICLR